LELVDALYLRGVGSAEFVGLTGDANKCPGGLFPGHDLRSLLQGKRGLDPVAGVDALATVEWAFLRWAYS